jgi:hypothetical protein
MMLIEAGKFKGSVKAMAEYVGTGGMTMTEAE